MQKRVLATSIAAIFGATLATQSTSHAASTVSFTFNCSVDYRTSPNSCGTPTGSYGTLTIADSLSNPGNAVDISWNITPGPGMGTQLSRFLLNYESGSAPGALTFSVPGSPANYGANGWDTAVGEYGKFDIRIGFLGGALSGSGTLTAGVGGLSASGFDATTDGGSPVLRALYRMNDGNGVYGAGIVSPPPTPDPVTPTLVNTVTTTQVVVTNEQNTSQPVITATRKDYDKTEAHRIQTIVRTTTNAVITPWLRTTTSTPITVNTYSDGTVSSVEGTSSITKEEYSLVYLTEQKDNFSGRIDQHDKLASLNLGIDRSLNMDVFRQDGICLNKNAKDCANSFRLFVNGSATNASLYDEYSATSKTYGIGTDYSINEDWRIGAQVNRVNTKMTGVDSLTHQDKTHYGIFSSYSLANFILVSNFGYAQNHVNSNRNIQGIFENSHSVNGQTVWLQNRLYAPTMQGVKPFVGYTFGRTERNAYMETGSIESSRQVGSIKDNTNYAEAGLRANQAFGKFAINGEASLTSDSFKTLGIRATYTVFKDTDISFGVSRQIGDGLASNAVSLRAGVRF